MIGPILALVGCFTGLAAAQVWLRSQDERHIVKQLTAGRSPTRARVMNRPYLLLELARKRLLEGRYEEVLKWLLPVLPTLPDAWTRTYALCMVAHAQMEIGHGQQAQRMLEECEGLVAAGQAWVKDPIITSLVASTQAALALAHGEFDRCLASCRNLRQRGIKDPWVSLIEADCWSAMGWFEGASANYLGLLHLVHKDIKDMIQTTDVQEHSRNGLAWSDYMTGSQPYPSPQIWEQDPGLDSRLLLRIHARMSWAGLFLADRRWESALAALAWPDNFVILPVELKASWLALRLSAQAGVDPHCISIGQSLSTLREYAQEYPASRLITQVYYEAIGAVREAAGELGPAGHAYDWAAKIASVPLDRSRLLALVGRCWHKTGQTRQALEAWGASLQLVSNAWWSREIRTSQASISVCELAQASQVIL